MSTKQTTTTEEEAPSNAFSTLLNTHRRGIAGHECSVKLEECLKAALDTGCKAEMTVKVTFSPGIDDQVEIKIQPSAKLPEQKLPSAIFWVDDNGKLTTSDPKQAELPIREVIRVGGGEIKEPVTKRA